MKIKVTRNEPIYYGNNPIVCTHDYASCGGLLSIWEWCVEPDSGLEHHTLIWPDENCLYYTRDEQIYIEVEYSNSGKPSWMNIYDGLGLCVPAGHVHRICSESSEPARLELLRVPALAEDRKRMIEECQFTPPDIDADLLSADWCMPFVRRLSALEDVEFWPGL